MMFLDYKDSQNQTVVMILIEVQVELNSPAPAASARTTRREEPANSPGHLLDCSLIGHNSLQGVVPHRIGLFIIYTSFSLSLSN